MSDTTGADGEQMSPHQSKSQLSLFLAVFVPLFAVYFLTSTRTVPYHIDPMTNAVLAESLGNRATPVLDGFEELTNPEFVGNLGWFVDSPNGPTAQYPPGAALLAAPFYAISTGESEVIPMQGVNNPSVAPVGFPVPPLSPAAIAASASTAAAIGFLAITFAQLASRKAALLGAYVAGLGTSAWSVASDSLWQHGPAMMWLALGGWLLSRGRLTSSGLGYAGAILTRPHTAVVAASVGIGSALRSRSFLPLVRVGLSSAIGLSLLIAYNRALYGQWTVSGGYGDAFTDNFVSRTPWSLAHNTFLGLFHWRYGLIWWSPFLVVSLAGLRAGWTMAPGWARSSFIGGLVYLMFQYQANRASGGDGFFAYRYPLEALVACGPLLFLGFCQAVNSRRIRRFATAATSIAVISHAIGAVL